MAVLKYARGIAYRHGGDEHRGWLPPGASAPLPTPVRDLTLDLTIEGNDGTGYLLIYAAREGGLSFDDWFLHISEAEAAAEAKFGVGPEQWQDA